MSGGPQSRVCREVVLVTVSALVLMVLTTWPARVGCLPLLFQEEPQIVSQDLLSGKCIDNNGAERNDLDEWTSSSGSCDKIVCHVEPSGNYTVTHDCRPLEPSENPDTTNCNWQTNSTAAYPDCCPELVCGAAATYTTVDPNSCFDIASAYACGVWANLTSQCTDTSVDVYNYTQTFCRDYCGIC